MAPLHKPTERAAERAAKTLAHIDQPGKPHGLVCGDRLYSNSVPERFQLPIAAIGYGTLFDYKSSQLGKQGSYAGAPMIKGHYCCPAMLEPMVNAEIDEREKRIPVDLSLDRHTERKAYRLQSKGRPQPDGSQRLICPAVGRRR